MFLRLMAQVGVAWMLLMATQGAWAQGRSIVVLSLHAEYGVDPAVASLLSEQVVEQVRNSRAFEKVLGQSDLQGLIGDERSAQLTQCDSEGCLAELAGSFGAGFVLRGSIGKLGTSHLLTLRLLDVSRAVLVATTSERIRGEGGDALLDGVPTAVIKLLDGAKIAHQLRPAASAEPTASKSVAPAAAPAPAAAEELEGGGPPWKALGAGALACTAVSCCLVAPLGFLAAYAGVGFAAMFATKTPWMGDVVGGGAGAVVALVPMLVGAVGAALAAFAFTRPSGEAAPAKETK